MDMEKQFQEEVVVLLDLMTNFGEHVTNFNVESSDSPKSWKGVELVMNKVIKSVVHFTAEIHTGIGENRKNHGSLLENQKPKILNETKRDLSLALIGLKYIMNEEWEAITSKVIKLATMRIEKLIIMFDYQSTIRKVHYIKEDDPEKALKAVKEASKK